MNKGEKKYTGINTIQVLLLIGVGLSSVLAIKGMINGDGQLLQRGCILGALNATLLATNVCGCLKKRNETNS